ncbi:hypothetical protein ACERNI_13930 [Camelimonas sp. ID_303_24]
MGEPMPYELSHLRVDLTSATVTVHLTKHEAGQTFSIQIDVPAPKAEDQSENALRATAREAAKSALLEAADAL